MLLMRLCNFFNCQNGFLGNDSQIIRIQNSIDMKGMQDKKTDPSHGLNQNRACESWRHEQLAMLYIFSDTCNWAMCLTC